MKTLTILAFVAGSVGFSAWCADWPQYRGPNHDGSTTEKISIKWPESGLRQIWKTPLHNGFSSFAVGGGNVYTLVTREVEGTPSEVCVALAADSGKELWAVPLGIAKYQGGGDSGAPGNDGGDGPRSTPTYDNGKVYVFSSTLLLKCLNATDGKEVWSCDLIKEHAGRNIPWKSAASPMIDGDLLYVAGGGPGEALLAFDKTDGHVVWKGQDDKMTHSTPLATTILGERQIIFHVQKGLVAVAPKTGDILWRYPFRYSTAAGVSAVVSGDIVYVTQGYNIGSSACKITKTNDAYTATELWTQTGNSFGNHWSSPVVSNGYLYGIFGHGEFGKAPLKCIELATGTEKWAKTGFGPGGLTLVDGNVLVLSDAGDLVLVKATPDAYTELDRSHVLAGKCWNAAAISNGRIYARSTKEGVCLDVSN